MIHLNKSEVSILLSLNDPMNTERLKVVHSMEYDHVHKSVDNLRELGFIDYDDDNLIIITNNGVDYLIDLLPDYYRI